MKNKIVEFYRAIREDQPLLDQLVTIEDTEQLVDALMSAGPKFGFDLKQDDIRQGLDSLVEIIEEVGNDDELNDFELGFVSAGGAPCFFGSMS